MKIKIEEFLEIDELELKAVLYVAIGTILTLPIGYWVVFAEFGWWLP